MMQEPSEFHKLMMEYRHEIGFGFIAFVIAVFRRWEKGERAKKIIANGVFCAALAFGVTEILEQLGINSAQWGYLSSCFIGYIGVESIMAGLADRFPNIFTSYKK